MMEKSRKKAVEESPPVPAPEDAAPTETRQNQGPPLAEEVIRLQSELDALQKQSAENFEGWQRERADFANYKRRIDRDHQCLSQNLAGEIIKKYLVVLDDLERALKVRPQDGEGAIWADGIELILRKMQGILDSEGITRMEVEGMEFDPNLHEAITHEESLDHKSNEIIEVVQHGYRIGDRVLRPARVRVAQ
jgi:molecular chaperone GrpE